MIQFVVSLVQNRPVVVVQWLAHLTGIFRVSGPALGEGGRGGGGFGTLFLLCLNPLEIFIVVCVHGSICPVSISIFCSFFFRKSFTMNHLVFFFLEVKLESESFSVIAKLDPIR